MRLVRATIMNFKSIEGLTLNLDRPLIAIEGPNDVGKSNLLEAMALAARAIPAKMQQQVGHGVPGVTSEWPNGWQPHHAARCFRDRRKKIEIELTFKFSKRDLVSAARTFELEEASFKVEYVAHAEFEKQWPTVNLVATKLAPQPAEVPWEDLAYLLGESFRLLTVARPLEYEQNTFNRDEPWEQVSRWEGNNLKKLLFFYKNSLSLEVQQRFERLRTILNDSRLPVGDLNLAVLPSGQIKARTRTSDGEFDLDSRGTGVQQLVTVLALAICHRGRILAIEEPESSLSEPNQRLLWAILRDIAGSGDLLDQVFLTSHSRIFEEETPRLVASKTGGKTSFRWVEAEKGVPSRPDELVLPVTRGGGVTLPQPVLERLKITEGKSVFLFPRGNSYAIAGADGYAEFLKSEADDDSGREPS